MQVSTTSTLLDIWDGQSGLDHVGRVQRLLDGAAAGLQSDLATLAIGERDRRLLDLREQLFGSQIEALEDCPWCGAQLEVAFDIDAVRMNQPSPEATHANSLTTIQIGGYVIDARLPTSADLRRIRGCLSVEEARVQLLESCLVGASRDGAPVEAGDLPQAVQDAVSRALGQADPQAEIELQLECAACGNGWTSRFDIVDYLWAEVEQFGRRTLHDVHLLARAYGWSEGEILALSPRRRNYYLELVLDG